MNNVDWKNDCQLRNEFGGFKLWTRWCNRFRASPTKFPGSKQEWIVEYPSGDAVMGFSKSKAIQNAAPIPTDVAKNL